MRREFGRVDRRGMTTSNDKSGRWSNLLRSLTPGPVALGVQSCLDRAVWEATWGAMGSKRLVARPVAEPVAEPVTEPVTGPVALPVDQPRADIDVVTGRTRQ
jgi:hypothetical protein